MSVEAYIPEKYLTKPEAYDECGINETLQADLTQAEKARFAGWVREGNNKVETNLFPDSDSIPLVKGTPIFTYARDAVINWVQYKRRNYTGSINAKESKNDFLDNIKLAKELLKRTPTEKNIPIQKAEVTDSLENYKIPYSQTQGYPPDILY